MIAQKYAYGTKYNDRKGLDSRENKLVSYTEYRFKIITYKTLWVAQSVLSGFRQISARDTVDPE